MAIRIFGREFGASPSPPPHAGLDALMAEAAAHPAWFNIRRSDQLQAGRALLDTTPAEQVVTVQAALARLGAVCRGGMGQYAQQMILAKLISDLLRRDLPFAEADLVAVLGHARGFVHSYGVLPMGSVVKTAEGFVRRGSASPTTFAVRWKGSCVPSEHRPPDRRTGSCGRG